MHSLPACLGNPDDKRLKQLEDENKRLKTLVADLSLDNQMLRHLSEGNW
jgi:putative transposase